MKNTWSPRVRVLYQKSPAEEVQFLVAQLGEIIYDWLANFEKNPDHKLSTRTESLKTNMTQGNVLPERTGSDD